ncbi:MAG: hypothetical protein ACRYG8_51120 [Janthinobacterium lividum]
MNKQTAVPSEATTAGVSTRAFAREPVTIPAIGRQRVGKTTFLNGLAQIALSKRADLDIWNADVLNRSHSLSTFHSHAVTPEQGSLAEQTGWIERQIMSQIESRRDAILDVGGGLTALHGLIDETPLAELMESTGVSLVAAYLVGTEAGDIDYLDELQSHKLFLPRKSLIILNEGLVTSGRLPKNAFAQILSHPVIKKARAGGAVPVFMPALSCMAQVTDRGLSFADFMNGIQKEGHPTTSIFDRARVRRWFELEFPAFLQSIPADYLPRLPDGVTW